MRESMKYIPFRIGFCYNEREVKDWAISSRWIFCLIIITAIQNINDLGLR